MPIASHHRRLPAQVEQVNMHSWTSFTTFFKYLWFDNVTPEMRAYTLKTLRDLILMITELLTESVMVQVVSLVPHNRTPLRDLAQEYLNNTNGIPYKFAYFGESTYQVDSNILLFLWIFYCFLHGGKGLKVLQKGVRCLTIARVIRVMTFSMTILPNPNPECNFTGPVDPFYINTGKLFDFS